MNGTDYAQCQILYAGVEFSSVSTRMLTEIFIRGLCFLSRSEILCLYGAWF
jgi:hypothetical protein